MELEGLPSPGTHRHATVPGLRLPHNEFESQILDNYERFLEKPGGGWGTEAEIFAMRQGYVQEIADYLPTVTDPLEQLRAKELMRRYERA